MGAGAAQPSFGRARYATAISCLVLLFVAVGLPQVYKDLSAYTYFLLIDQDVLVTPLFVAACFVTAHRTSQRAVPGRPVGPGELTWVLLCMAAVVLLCWAGHYVLFRGVDLTRDEQMVWFDAGIFRDLALVWPIPPEWRDLANALNRKFMLPIGSAEAWVSAYLPVNAALHAVIGAIADDDLTAPLCVAAGGFFLWRIGRLLWPDELGARFAALALYFTSSQILVTGMTKYAMSAHMALNLAWLWLFLRNRRGSHALAMLLGFVGTGLHQPLFHPLFALPFVLLLAARREWRMFAAYGVAYGLIGTFWLAWPMLMSGFGTGPVVPVSSAQGLTYLERLLGAFDGLGVEGFWLTCANLVRFVTWQHPLLLPLAAYGAWACWRSEPLVRALAASLILPVLVLWILLPWQGNGWGYRYLHPAIGSAMLLGGWGWHSLSKQGLSLRAPFLWATALAALLLFPFRALIVHQTVRQFAQTERVIASQEADIVIVDGKDTEFVHNRHDLSNRPLRLIAQNIPISQMASLCSKRTIVFVDGAPPRPASRWQKHLKARAETAGCKTTTVVVWLGPLRRWQASFAIR